MKHASYRAAVQWIADNDNPGDMDPPGDLAGYVSTILVADLFGVDPARVAKDIWKARGGY